MELNEDIMLKGEFKLTVRDAKTGKVIPEECQEFENIITTAFKLKIINAINSSSNNCALSHIEVGSGTTTPTASDTGCTTPIGARKAFTESSVTGFAWTSSTSFGTGDNNGTWNEVALHTALTGGACGSHALFAVAFTKNSSKTATLDYTLTFA